MDQPLPRAGRVAAFAAVGAVSAFVRAATFTWDPTHLLLAGGGGGTWTATSADWSDGTADVAWPGAAATAAFGGPIGGTVTLSDDIAARGLVFNTTGYTIDGPKTLTVGPGGITVGGSLALKSAVVFDGNGLIASSGVSTVTFDRGLAGTGGLTITADGTMSKTHLTTLNLNGVSTYAGNTTVNTAAKALTKIVLGVNNALPTSTVLTLNTLNKSVSSAVLQLNGKSQTLAGLVANSDLTDTTNTQVLGDGTLTIDSASAAVYNGLIDRVAVVKTGVGKQTFGGKNQYTGGTTVSGGTLVAANAESALGTKTTTVGGSSASSGGTLAGGGATGGAVVVNAFGTITAGDGGTVGDSAGKLTTTTQAWNGGGAYAVKFKSATAGTSNANGTLAGGSAATWDTLAMTTLDLKGLSAGSPFRLTVAKALGGGFAASAAGEFVIATTTSIQTAASPNGMAARTDLSSLFTLDTGGSGIADTHFSVFGVFNSATSTDLVLRYDAEAAPEPGAAALLTAGGTVVLRRRRRRT